MSFLTEVNNEDCGCDNNFYSVINESPLLSGAQENSFNTTLENNSVNNNIVANNLKNNNINNMSANSNNKMNNNSVDISQFLNNQPQQNQQNAVNEQNIQNILNSIPDTNKRNNNQLPDMGAPRQNQEQILLNNQLMANNNANQLMANNVNYGSEQSKFIATHFNYVIVVLVALAINDLARYYINRSIKFQNGSHTYYIYYTVGIGLLLYIFSKYVNRL
jgi:hypothetical protein